MSTTVTNTNPVTITGGTMAAGARATIYPNQIARSFKVTQVDFIATTANDQFIIGDNSTANNVLIQGIANAANTTLTYSFNPARTWADWKVTVLTTATDKVLVYLK